jgi:hypothetical protein
MIREPGPDANLTESAAAADLVLVHYGNGIRGALGATVRCRSAGQV